MLLPPFNRSQPAPRLNAVLRAELKRCAEEMIAYADGEVMPHARGSIDTYDDMRNSIRAVSVLIEGVLDAQEEDEPTIARVAYDQQGERTDELEELACVGIELGGREPWEAIADTVVAEALSPEEAAEKAMQRRRESITGQEEK